MKVKRSTVILLGVLFASLVLLFFVSKNRKTSVPQVAPLVQASQIASPVTGKGIVESTELASVKEQDKSGDSKTKEQQYLQEIERLNREILLLRKKAEISKIQKEIHSFTSKGDNTTPDSFATFPLNRDEEELFVQSGRNRKEQGKEQTEGVKTETVFRVAMTTIMNDKKIAVLNVSNNDVIVTEKQSFTVGKKTYRVQSISPDGVVVSDGQETYYVPVMESQETVIVK